MYLQHSKTKHNIGGVSFVITNTGAQILGSAKQNKYICLSHNIPRRHFDRWKTVLKRSEDHCLCSNLSLATSVSRSSFLLFFNNFLGWVHPTKEFPWHTPQVVITSCPVWHCSPETLSHSCQMKLALLGCNQSQWKHVRLTEDKNVFWILSHFHRSKCTIYQVIDELFF